MGSIMHENDIDIPEDLYSLIPEYLDRRKEELVQLKKACQNQEWPYLLRIGHSLKGTSPGYGLVKLGSIGRLLEDCSRRQDQKESLQAIEEYQRHLLLIIEYFDHKIKPVLEKKTRDKA